MASETTGGSSDFKCVKQIFISKSNNRSNYFNCLMFKILFLLCGEVNFVNFFPKIIACKELAKNINVEGTE